MRWFALILIASFVTVSATLWAVLKYFVPVGADGISPWITAYYTQARIPMFTGFLTLGSFLLTLQTAIIQRLKDAYDTDDYKLRYLVLKEKNPKVRYYGSLERMSIALSTNVILALTTAAAQMSLGFCQTKSSTACCVGLAITTLGLVVYLTLQLLLAHKEWFEKIENQKHQELNSPSTPTNLPTRHYYSLIGPKSSEISGPVGKPEIRKHIDQNSAIRHVLIEIMGWEKLAMNNVTECQCRITQFFKENRLHFKRHPELNDSLEYSVFSSDEKISDATEDAEDYLAAFKERMEPVVSADKHTLIDLFPGYEDLLE